MRTSLSWQPECGQETCSKWLNNWTRSGISPLKCGSATFDSCIRYLNEDPWQRLRDIKKKMDNTCAQMLLRGQNLVGTGTIRMTWSRNSLLSPTKTELMFSGSSMLSTIYGTWKCQLKWQTGLVLMYRYGLLHISRCTQLKNMWNLQNSLKSLSAIPFASKIWQVFSHLTKPSR